VLTYERQAKKKGYVYIIGVDEAGRGPLAGPVVVGAVHLKTTKFRARIDDSKKLTALARQRAFNEIIEKSVFGIGIMSEVAVDSVNISVATALAVDAAVTQLFRRIGPASVTAKNTILLLDGRLRCGLSFPAREIIGGDGKSMSIAAASIIAKVFRDRLMGIYDKIYPGYDFAVHKGYGTKKHRLHLKRRGMSPIHRRTFCDGHH
jgi:ribonuclease HII